MWSGLEARTHCVATRPSCSHSGKLSDIVEWGLPVLAVRPGKASWRNPQSGGQELDKESGEPGQGGIAMQSPTQAKRAAYLR